MSAENLLIIETTDKDAIEQALFDFGVYSGIFTNGIYADKQDVVLPTTLAGFKFAVDHYSDGDEALIVAINSNDSMNKVINARINKTVMDGQIKARSLMIDDEATLTDAIAIITAEVTQTIKNLEKLRVDSYPQEDRAAKLFNPLAEQFPDRKIVIMYYDEETPTELYDMLAMKGFGMNTLFKWGFGTKPDAPRIEGAGNFTNVLAFPFMNDAKAICHDITVAENQSDFVKVFKLHEEEGTRPAYITTDSKLPFDLAESLQKYAEATAPAQPFVPPVLGR